jgi:protein-S-isoprenylcysteine O-methyltransferase Ste14
MSSMSGRRPADIALFVVTAVELALLARYIPTFEPVDWVYLSQHLLVLAIALTRPAPKVQDRSWLPAFAVVVAYTYPYGQMLWLSYAEASLGWPTAGLVLILLAASLSLTSLLTLGRSFGLRPALRKLATSGPYRLVRHPMYLSYVIADVGYNLQEWNPGTVLLVLAGWAAMVYRILAEERMLAHDAAWADYRAAVRYRLLPGLW